MENEEILSAETTDEEVINDTIDTNEDTTLADGSREDVGNDEEFTDSETDDSEETQKVEEVKKEEKPKQSKKVNKEFAEKRRDEKQQETELKVLKEYVKVNPYTNTPIETLRDAKVYKLMRKIEDDGGDPIIDFHKYSGMEEQRVEEEHKANADKIKKEVEDFRKSYPDVDLNEMNKDEDFVKFSNRLLGKVPLKDVYESYQDIKASAKNSAEQVAKNELAKKIAKQKTSAGDLSTNGSADAPKYTIEQIGKMSQSEIDKNWKDVEASYNYWQKHK